MSTDAKECPWCGRWALKDNACAYIFACGLDEKNIFHVGQGCGRSWCWTCGKKFCGHYYDASIGKKLAGAKDSHEQCCRAEEGFKAEDYCPGGHSSHCNLRW